MKGLQMLTQQQLAEIRMCGMMTGAKEQFVDPATISECTRVLDSRGERWASEVLGRDLTRRSRMFPRYPWLKAGEEYVIVMADKAEVKAQFDGIVGND